MRPALFKSDQWHFHQDNAPVHNSILVTDYLTKMGIKTVRHPPYSPDLAPCDFWLFPKLRGCRYETIEEMKEAVMKVIDTLTQEDFHGSFQKLLERHNKCIAAGGDHIEGNKSFMCVLSLKVPIRKRSGNLFNIYIWKLYCFLLYLRDRQMKYLAVPVFLYCSILLRVRLLLERLQCLKKFPFLFFCLRYGLWIFLFNPQNNNFFYKGFH